LADSANCGCRGAFAMEVEAMRSDILEETKEQLRQCKEVLSRLSPAYFMGAGLQFVSLIARQVLIESTGASDNPLGWEKNLQDAGWLLKHQREVSRLTQYCI